MSESSPNDMAHAHDAASLVDRDAKIEQLLLTGLDHYFAAQYQQAINVWTRALFLDRSHARARAYIERARSAMAERQREAEEKEALAVREGATHADLSQPAASARRAARTRETVEVPAAQDSRGTGSALILAAVVVTAVALGGYALTSPRLDWRL